MIPHAIECTLLSLTLVVGGSDMKKVDHTDQRGGGGGAGALIPPFPGPSFSSVNPLPLPPNPISQ